MHQIHCKTRKSLWITKANPKIMTDQTFKVLQGAYTRDGTCDKHWHISTIEVVFSINCYIGQTTLSIFCYYVFIQRKYIVWAVCSINWVTRLITPNILWLLHFIFAQTSLGWEKLLATETKYFSLSFLHDQCFLCLNAHLYCFRENLHATCGHSFTLKKFTRFNPVI